MAARFVCFVFGLSILMATAQRSVMATENQADTAKPHVLKVTPKNYQNTKELQQLLTRWASDNKDWPLEYKEERHGKSANFTVGQMSDMCTGESWPELAFYDQKPQSFGEIDFEKLSVRDEASLKAFIGTATLDGYICGTMFQIGDPGPRIAKRLSESGIKLCLPDNVVTKDVFVDYVRKHPEVRESKDFEQVFADAFKERFSC